MGAKRRVRSAAAAVVGALLASALLWSPSAVAATTDPALLRRSGAQLVLHGGAYRFTGVNAYSLATLWSHNAGCGSQVDDLDGLFASLRPDSVVRVWAFQALGTNARTRRTDFAGIDRVVAAAGRHRQRVLLVLSNQDGGCDDGHWHDQAWYAGGYRSAYRDDGRGLAPMSFLGWVRTVVPRYRASDAVAGWELVNEPEAAGCARGLHGGACYGSAPCPATAAATLRAFTDAVGGEVKRLDPRHLLFSGALGGGQCGFAGADYARVHASRAVDVATFHDYGHVSTALPAELSLRLAQARALRKPLIVEEAGIEAGPACRTLAARARLVAAKIAAARAAGAVGYLPWNWSLSASSSCTDDLGPRDPVWGLLRRS